MRNDDAERKMLMQKIDRILDLETEKPYNEMDSDLVDECVDFFMEMNGNEERLSKKEIAARVRRIFPETMPEDNQIWQGKKSRRISRRILFAAAITIVILLIMALATVANEGDIIYHYLQNRFGVITDASDDVTFSVGDKTFWLDKGAGKLYASADELIDGEEISILFPTYLPDGEKATNIFCSYTDGETRRVTFLAKDGETDFSVECDSEINPRIVSDATSVEKIGGYECYCFNMEDVGLWQANFVYGGDCYAISTPLQSELVKIIEGLKEF